jgi:phospholipid/cholesterol/gamma-HCH transport system ATP-binding protein
MVFLHDGLECRRMNTSSAPLDPIIRMREVSASYGSRRVLDSVSLDVQRGEILVLLGGSGSGKTTLLKQVLGLMKPSTGSIVVNGVDITSCSPSELDAVRRHIGVAFQAAALFNSMSVQANVALPLQELTKLADSTISLITWIKLWMVGLAEAAHLYPSELSGGMRKRAAIARAIALDPQILVFDEPSAGLDPIVAAGLDELIVFLNDILGITILVVTHHLESAFRIADRIAMLHQGHLIAVDEKELFAGTTHPRIRQFLDRKPDVVGSGEQGFTTAYLKEFQT